MWKNEVELDRPQVTISYGTCALHAGYLRLQTNTQSMQYLLLSIAKMVVRTRSSVMLYVQYFLCLV